MPVYCLYSACVLPVYYPSTTKLNAHPSLIPTVPAPGGAAHPSRIAESRPLSGEFKMHARYAELDDSQNGRILQLIHSERVKMRSEAVWR
jgi:hypothetical protein